MELLDGCAEDHQLVRGHRVAREPQDAVDVAATGGDRCRDGVQRRRVDLLGDDGDHHAERTVGRLVVDLVEGDVQIAVVAEEQQLLAQLVHSVGSDRHHRRQDELASHGDLLDVGKRRVGPSQRGHERGRDAGSVGAGQADEERAVFGGGNHGVNLSPPAVAR